MPGRKVEPRRLWNARAKLEVNDLALAVQYTEEGKGSQKKRYIKATDWLGPDDETLLFDTGKRMKGWLKEQGQTLGGTSMKDKIAYGVVCQSHPKKGYQSIGTLESIRASSSWGTWEHRGEYVLNDMPEPEVETLLTEDKRSVFALFYVLKNSVKVEVSINGFGQAPGHDIIKDWMEKLGPIKGIGDKHTASDSFGTFKVLEYELVSDTNIKY